MTRSITHTVSCTIPKRQLWTLVRYKNLHSDFTTSLGTWTDTVIPMRVWADTHDHCWDLPLWIDRVPRTDFSRRILLGPMPAKAATRKSPGEQITLQQKMDGNTMIDATLPLLGRNKSSQSSNGSKNKSNKNFRSNDDPLKNIVCIKHRVVCAVKKITGMTPRDTSSFNSSIVQWCPTAPIVPNWKRSMLRTSQVKNAKRREDVFSCSPVIMVCPLKVLAATNVRSKRW